MKNLLDITTVKVWNFQSLHVLRYWYSVVCNVQVSTMITLRMQNLPRARAPAKFSKWVSIIQIAHEARANFSILDDHVQFQTCIRWIKQQQQWIDHSVVKSMFFLLPRCGLEPGKGLKYVQNCCISEMAVFVVVKMVCTSVLCVYYGVGTLVEDFHKNLF